MRKKAIMRQISSILAFILGCVIVLSAISPMSVVALEPDEKYYYTLNSNTLERNNILLHEYDGVVYIVIDDLCALTRSELESEDQIFTVTQGIWKVTFDYDQQQFSDGWQTVETRLINTGIYNLVPAAEFLTYFGANVEIDRASKTFYCFMPECTAWEALAVDYENTLVDIYKLYGGEGKVEFSLTLDILMDFILNGTPNSDDYLLDAYNEALSINLCDFDSIQGYQKTRDEGLYDYLISDEGQDAADYASKLLDNSISGVEYLCESYYNTTNLKFADLVKNSYEAGFLDESTHYAEQILNGYRKNRAISDISKNSKLALTQVAPVFIQTALESAQQLKYAASTNNLAYRVMGDENVHYLGLNVDDNDWFRIANTYKNTSTVVSNAFLGNAISSFSDMGWDQLIGDCVQSFTGTSALLFSFSKECATTFAKWFPLTSSSVEAFESDRKALYLSELQQNVAYVISNIDFSKNYVDETLYRKYIEAALFYCRVSIAMYQNLITVVSEFGNDRDYWTSLFQSRIDSLAVSMYKLTLFQDDGAGACIPPDLKKVPLVTDAYSEEFGGRKFNIPQINLSGDAVANINAEIWATLYDGIVVDVSEWWNQEHYEGSESITYNWYLNNDILSLVIESHPVDWAWTDYYVYNIDITTGKELSSEALFEDYGISVTEYKGLAEQVLGSKFWSAWDRTNENFQNNNFISWFNEALQKTISQENIDQTFPYINDKGELCMIAKVYSLAGADYYWNNLNMVDFTLVPDYAVPVESNTHTINISEDEAYQIACDYWNYEPGDISTETGFELFVVPEYGGGLREISSTGKSYYSYMLRWLVVDPEDTSNTWMSTCDIIFIDAETGECVPPIYE